MTWKMVFKYFQILVNFSVVKIKKKILVIINNQEKIKMTIILSMLLKIYN